MVKDARADVAPAEAPTLPQTPEPPRRSLGDILTTLNEMDAVMSDGDIDPAALIGAMKENDSELREKIDAVRYVIEEYEQYSERMEARAAYYARKAKAAGKNASRLCEYVAMQMRVNKFERLPGLTTAFVLKPASTPAFTAARLPEASDVMNEILAPFVRVIPGETSYEWDKNAIKKGVADGRIGADMLKQIGKLETSTSLEFEDADKPRVTPRKKGK